MFVYSVSPRKTSPALKEYMEYSSSTSASFAQNLSPSVCLVCEIVNTEKVRVAEGWKVPLIEVGKKGLGHLSFSLQLPSESENTM